MKKLFTVFTLAMLLFCSCSSDDNKEDDLYTTVEDEVGITYSRLLVGDDGYMYYETSGSVFAASDVISYEIGDIVGEPTLRSHTRGSKYDPVHKVNLFTIKYVIDLTVEQWNEIKNDVDLNTPFVTFTRKFKLKKGYTKY